MNITNKERAPRDGVKVSVMFSSYSVYIGPEYEKSALLILLDGIYQTRAGVVKIRKNNKKAGRYERHGFKKL